MLGFLCRIDLRQECDRLRHMVRAGLPHRIDNPPKGALMILWKKYTRFSSEFLTEQHDLFLYNVFHHIKAFLLFPPKCNCGNSCRCNVFRDNVVLTLNTELYNKALKGNKDPGLLSDMKHIWQIPDDFVFRENQANAYPLWLVEHELQKREKENHFEIVNRLVWTLLRLGKTYEASPFNAPEASLKKSIEHILGKNPLKRKTSTKESYLGGEKAYLARFNEYQAVLPFIAALTYVKKGASITSLNKPSQIETFLKTAHWLRKELLRLETPNIKQSTMFLETTFLPLPSWVNSEDIQIPLEPFQEILDDIESRIEGPFDPAEIYKAKKLAHIKT